jgi:hypothetical protein
MKGMTPGKACRASSRCFSVEVTSIADTFKEQGQRQASWVPLAEAGRMVEEPEMRGIFIRLDAELRAKSRR